MAKAAYSEQEILDILLDITESLVPDVDRSKITMNSVISRDIGADSMTLVMMITKVEATLGIKFPDRGWDKLQTVGDVVKLAEKQLKKKK